mmetsp:Transcript_950/g.1087  ORF Transcript_950/g.1087 Transcript_950/m.1087 type:complete len:87 (-) Transcript_950:183-443(-)
MSKTVVVLLDLQERVLYWCYTNKSETIIKITHIKHGCQIVTDRRARSTDEITLQGFGPKKPSVTDVMVCSSKGVFNRKIAHEKPDV